MKVLLPLTKRLTCSHYKPGQRVRTMKLAAGP